MTSLLAMMAVCMPASIIDINTPIRLPVPYTQDRECSCGNSGRIGGVWLNYYSPCRCGSTTIVLDMSFPLPPLREDPPDTQLHPILHPSVYSPSLNPLFTFDSWGTLIHPHHGHLLDHRFLNRHLLETDHHFGDMSFKINSKYFSDIAPTTTVVPEPGTLALLAVGTAVIVRRRKKAA